MSPILSAVSAEVADPRSPTPSSVLRAAEKETLSVPVPRYGLLARTLFGTLELVYGKAGSLAKFVVLELVARVPYQAWENVGYVAISHTASKPRFARRVFDYVRESRAQQDNEQWHLLILEELVAATELALDAKDVAYLEELYQPVPNLLSLGMS